MYVRNNPNKMIKVVLWASHVCSSWGMSVFFVVGFGSSAANLIVLLQLLFCLLIFLCLLKSLILRFQRFLHHWFNFLTVIKDWLQSMWQWQVRIQDLGEHLRRIGLIKLLRWLGHKRIHLIHELFNLNNNMMASFPFFTCQFLHIFQLCTCQT